MNSTLLEYSLAMLYAINFCTLSFLQECKRVSLKVFNESNFIKSRNIQSKLSWTIIEINILTTIEVNSFC